MVQIKGNLKGRERKSFFKVRESFDIWNCSDYLRIFAQTLFLILPNANSFAFLTLISWLGLLKYLRLFKPLRIFIQLLVACISASSRFLVVLVVMLIAFTNTFYVKARWNYREPGLEQGIEND